MNFSRKADSIYEDRYRVVNGERDENWLLCVYCGGPAGSRDHVPPISRVNDYDSFGMRTPMYLKVPSCVECNALGGDVLQDSFVERVEYIKDRLARRYARALATPEWDEEELNVLGRNLQSKVRAALARKNPLLARIEYYAGVDAVMNQLVEIYGDAPVYTPGM